MFAAYLLIKSQYLVEFLEVSVHSFCVILHENRVLGFAHISHSVRYMAAYEAVNTLCISIVQFTLYRRISPYSEFSNTAFHIIIGFLKKNVLQAQYQAERRMW